MNDDTTDWTELREFAAGKYEITGEFGMVSIEAERPVLRFEGNLHGSFA